MSEERITNGVIEIETGSTKHPDAATMEDGRVSATIGVYVGGSVAEAAEKYGEEFVHEQYVRSVVVAAQGKVRRALDQGIAIDKVEAEFNDLDPTEKSAGIADPQAQALRAFNKMDEGSQAQLLEALKSKLAGM